MQLTPNGRSSRVQLDGFDITSLLRNVSVRAGINDETVVELDVALGHEVELTALLPEAQVIVHVTKTEDPA